MCIVLKKVDSNTNSDTIKDFKGILKLVSPQNFGFIEYVFIEPKLIEEKKLTKGQLVNGRAILSFNKRKNE